MSSTASRRPNRLAFALCTLAAIFVAYKSLNAMKRLQPPEEERKSQDDADSAHGNVATVKQKHKPIKKPTKQESPIGDPHDHTPNDNDPHQLQIRRVARAFSPWNGKHEAWCIDKKTYRKTRPTGLFYVKVPKTASTTSASVNLQIAHRHGKRKFSSKRDEADQVCKDYHEHVEAWKRGFDKRDKAKSLLWTTIREPTKRAMSFVFFAKVSRQTKLEPTDENIIKTLRALGDNFQLNYIRTGELPWKSDDTAISAERKNELVEDAVRNVIREYDFVALTERMDESFTAMKMLFDLDFGDIMYISSKISGGWDGGRTGYGCMKIVKTFTSDGVDKFLKSKEWQDQNSADFLLYEAANRSLDLTIDKLGRSEFEKELAQYRKLLERVLEVCESKTVFRCTEDGVFQKEEAQKNCYTHDEGCGYPCIDEFVRLHVEEEKSYEDVQKKMKTWENPYK